MASQPALQRVWRGAMLPEEALWCSQMAAKPQGRTRRKSWPAGNAARPASGPGGAAPARCGRSTRASWKKAATITQLGDSPGGGMLRVAPAVLPPEVLHEVDQVVRRHRVRPCTPQHSSIARAPHPITCHSVL